MTMAPPTIDDGVQEVAILGIELYFPAPFVDQRELELFDGVKEGKYTIGLGQQRMAVPFPVEDSISMAMTVFSRLLRRHSLTPQQIGRIDVGSESNPDRAKSIKSHLVSLLLRSGQDNDDAGESPLDAFVNVAGSDCVQACHGGSAAYLNALAWLSSPVSPPGKFAVVVASDVAVYAPGPARPTGGAAAVALLLGCVPAGSAAIRCDLSGFGHAAANVYDFYKPVPGSEYPIVDGHLSVECYLRSVEAAVKAYESSQRGGGDDGADDSDSADDTADNDATDDADADTNATIATTTATTTNTTNTSTNTTNTSTTSTPSSSSSSTTDTISDPLLYLFHTPFARIAEKALTRLQASAKLQHRSLACLHLTRLLGNSYCASLYVNLLSCLVFGGCSGGAGGRAVLVSYGSGLMASAFSITVRPATANACPWLPLVFAQLHADLQNRLLISPAQCMDALEARERQFREPRGWRATAEMVETVREGAFYLESIDEQMRRRYVIKQQ